MTGKKYHIQIGASRIREEAEKSFESKDDTPQKNGQNMNRPLIVTLSNRSMTLNL